MIALSDILTRVPFLLFICIPCSSSDFVLAFEAGRFIEAARAQQRDASVGVRVEGWEATAIPTVVIVTADAGLEVVVDELQQCNVPCKLIKNMGELGEMLRAMDILEQEGACTPNITDIARH